MSLSNQRTTYRVRSIFARRWSFQKYKNSRSCPPCFLLYFLVYVTVALLAKAGGCSLREKAIVASTKIDPPDLVSYLIVEDEKLSSKNKGRDGSRHHRWWLERYHDDNSNIQVAILHVSPGAVAELIDIVKQENLSVRQSGGTKIVLNSASASERRENVRKLFMWTSISMAICCCSCFCLALCYQQGMILEERQQAAQQPQRPVRRRLTVPQVRENFPSFHYHPSSDAETATTRPLLLEEGECSICLDGKSVFFLNYFVCTNYSVCEYLSN